MSATGIATLGMGITSATVSASNITSDEVENLTERALDDPEVQALIESYDFISELKQENVSAEGGTGLNPILKIPFASTRSRGRGRKRMKTSGHIYWSASSAPGTMAVYSPSQFSSSQSIYISEVESKRVTGQSAGGAAGTAKLTSISEQGELTVENGQSTSTSVGVSAQSSNISSLSEFINEVRDTGVVPLVNPVMPCNFGEKDYIADITCVGNIIQANEAKLRSSSIFSAALASKNSYMILVTGFWALYDMATTGNIDIVCNPCTTSVSDSLSGVPIDSNDIPSNLPGDMEDYI